MGVLEPKDIAESDILSLASAEDVVRFFAKLGYNTNARTKQTPANINITGDEITRQISSVELVADQEGLLQVYLFELRSVTVAATQTIARALRNLPVNILMVLTTSDYERIDFVLLEKIAPKGMKKGPTPKQVGVVPRVLSVTRRSPDRKEMRLLRRLQYTEQDPWAQYAKLVSAFSMIGWTEEFYINRALFSDYVLNNRLRDTPDWQDNPSAVFKEFTKICYKARTHYSENKDLEFFMNKFVEPALKALGFHFKPNDTVHDMEENMVEVPDYHLYLSNQKDKAVGGLCAYPWERSLDNIDEVRDPELGARIPGQYVVRLLEKGILPWIVVTNGKFWRLYTKKTHSKATEFYEVDLEEILAMEDPQEAFRYFWLLFRAEAFKPKPYAIEGEDKEVSLLDRLLLVSEIYAKELGEKLKDNIFRDIFPKFAKGYIVRMGGTGKYLAMSQNERDEELSQVFRGTLTFLYRLLFLNYAESRDLLPVREIRGYWDVSLQKMKDEVAKKSGEIRDKVVETLKKGYDASGTTLYDRLTSLFEIVDKGSPRLNMPAYNGGLFFTDPSAADESMEAANARFMKLNKIPDRFLAAGIDLMARELDERTTRLEFIDYKSLGVRQLGSIYEGFLEFKIRVATEDIAVVKGKKTDEYVPLAEAKKPKEVIKKGEVYLENDRHERKATGSYYTPDYIVKYIVENTVGPVLAEKMEKLKPKLRSHAPEPTLVDELFEVRVLDPAMGSGHFLVEAVDLITDRLVDYLSRFSNNPVQMEIERARQEILSEMDKRGIVVDPARLTDLNLLRRYVLKRCIYGVDLNPMAVELAKVSLWLHCFTLGAPLSFLDHHLKCGNSLIGARVDEVAKEVESGQMTLLSTSRFGGVNKATDMMLKIGELSDITPDMVKKSRESYQKALAALEPYKRMLDVHTSRWFGNETEQPRRKKAKIPDKALAFLKSEESDKWLKDPDNVDHLSSDHRQIVDIAMNAAHNPSWRFFHWELEFPEVWFEKGKRKTNPGFDAVVGNPPYDLIKRDPDNVVLTMFVDYARQREEYEPVISSMLNMFHLMILRATSLVGPGNRMSQIVPLSLLSDPSSSGVRKLLIENYSISDIQAFPQKDDDSARVFPDAKMSTCIFVAQNKGQTELLNCRVHPGKDFLKDSPHLRIRIEEIRKFDSNYWTIPIGSSKDIHILQGIYSQNEIEPFSSVLSVLVGEIDMTLDRDCAQPSASQYELLKGAHLQRYYQREEPKQGKREWINLGAFRRKYGTSSPKSDLFKSSRVVFQGVTGIDDSRRLKATLVPAGYFLANSLNFVKITQVDVHGMYILALLNSQIMEWRFRLTSTNNNVNNYEILALPILRIVFATSRERREALLLEAQNLIDICEADLSCLTFNTFQNSTIGKWVATRLSGQPKEIDVLHDLLAHLASQMIELNNLKQAEVKRYLGLLESQLQIKSKDDVRDLEALTGKTKIKGYLGDYTKGEDETPFEKITNVLHKNKNKIGANLSDPRFINNLKTGYEKSLETLRPIKEKLKKTDWLIDQVVYRLYGLTEHEIAIVEGRNEK